MKILLIQEGWPDVRLLPDTALTPENMPVFVPQIGADWEMSWLAAYRIGRLGKNIALKFAPRYFDGMTLGFRLRPKDPEKRTPLVQMADYTLTLGEMLPMGDYGMAKIEDEYVKLPAPPYEQLVEWSHLTTVRTGDLMCVPLGMDCGLTTSTDAYLGSKMVLKKRIIL